MNCNPTPRLQRRLRNVLYIILLITSTVLTISSSVIIYQSRCRVIEFGAKQCYVRRGITYMDQLLIVNRGGVNTSAYAFCGNINITNSAECSHNYANNSRKCAWEDGKNKNLTIVLGRVYYCNYRDTSYELSNDPNTLYIFALIIAVPIMVFMPVYLCFNNMDKHRTYTELT